VLGRRLGVITKGFFFARHIAAILTKLPNLGGHAPKDHQ
jgi:hypothetical protein